MKSTYISQIIEQINLVTERCGPVLLFGENIDTGSRIAGLARGLKVNSAGKIQNVGNCELTHCGVGMGIMLDGGNSVLFMKQLDFLLLGLDQLVNTSNFVRACIPEIRGSFTIYPIVCDQGYQGPQSSLNSAGDFASLANLDVYCLNSVQESACIVGEQFVSPGFRIITTSQRLFGAEALDIPLLARTPKNEIFKYRSGSDVSIACFNFALREGVTLCERLESESVGADLFHVNFMPDMDMSMLIDSCAHTGKLVILDDSKTVTKFGDHLVTELVERRIPARVIALTRRGCPDGGYGVGDDKFSFDYDAVAKFCGSSRNSVKMRQARRVDGL